MKNSTPSSKELVIQPIVSKLDRPGPQLGEGICLSWAMLLKVVLSVRLFRSWRSWREGGPCADMDTNYDHLGWRWPSLGDYDRQDDVHVEEIDVRGVGIGMGTVGHPGTV